MKGFGFLFIPTLRLKQLVDSGAFGKGFLVYFGFEIEKLVDSGAFGKGLLGIITLISYAGAQTTIKIILESHLNHVKSQHHLVTQYY